MFVPKLSTNPLATSCNCFTTLVNVSSVAFSIGTELDCRLALKNWTLILEYTCWDYLITIKSKVHILIDLRRPQFKKKNRPLNNGRFLLICCLLTISEL